MRHGRLLSATTTKEKAHSDEEFATTKFSNQKNKT